MVLPRKIDVEYEVVHRGDHLFILLRDPERPNSELLVAPVSDPTKTTVSLSLCPIHLHTHVSLGRHVNSVALHALP